MAAHYLCPPLSPFHLLTANVFLRLSLPGAFNGAFALLDTDGSGTVEFGEVSLPTSTGRAVLAGGGGGVVAFHTV
jgi:hypothetical protein